MGELEDVFTNIGFFILFNSSFVFQYCLHRYLGLLLPIRRMLLICGPLSSRVECLSTLLLEASASSS
jgi:hypothetical protein